MKTSAEIRKEAYGLLTSGGWLSKLVATALVGLATGFLVTFLEILFFGLDEILEPKSLAASLCSSFFSLILESLTSFLFAYVFVAAAKKAPKTGVVFAGARAAFSRPLGNAYLYLRLAVQTFLYFLLLIVPGIIAIYRYRQAWFLKAEHPDWSAKKCIAESCRLAVGKKAEMFRLDCSYWVSITLAMLSTLLVLVHPLLIFLSLLFIVFVAWYLRLGQAIYYRELIDHDAT